ncbi:adenylate/guanylate cyclase domain-containing protein [Roseibium suaedae]|uniref:Adenylate cyclase n=1 Tax=Roseibium suaedae TaxID=735517 RepID=A0A1M7KM90_9HYPH|nr:adenylate/guanylate cyclase domain-containing protein [Roseibium suaedae]SHM66568.1 adenylate cyclase [Roseibium suaedae]
MRNPSLKSVILTLFLILTLPVFIGVIAFNYLSSESIARSDSLKRLEQHQSNAADSVENLFREVSASVETMASAGRVQPDLFEGTSSLDFLATVARGTPDVLSAYVGLEQDGTFLQARTMLPGQSIHDAPLPEGTTFAHRWIVPDGNGAFDETYEFLNADNQVTGRSQADSTYDPRKRLWYEVTKAADRLTISDPDLFATLSLVGFTIAAPIYWNEQFSGIVAIDLTLDGLSSYLAERRVSPNSVSFILDSHGNIIANSQERTVSQKIGDRLRLTHISEWADKMVGIIYSQREIQDRGAQSYFVQQEGRDYVASLKPIESVAHKDWQIFVIAPMDDFNAEIKLNNRRMLLIGLGATALQILIIWMLARKLSTPLERLVSSVENIRDLRQETVNDLPRTRVREIQMLSSAVETLDTAIRSFASFVPVSLVRDLLKSEQKLEIGGSSRFLTIFFSDIEGFSDLSEKIPSKELVQRVSDYLNIATKSVNREAGTIDKFIGDGVMAFWGAPTVMEDHARRACLAALHIQHAVGKLNADVVAAGGNPLRVRIGIHSDAVIVGNIGSSERMSYTVLGDGVNIASRLEALNKTYGTNICLSHSVYKEAGDSFCVRPIGDVRVKGRRASITVYELLGAYGQGAEYEPDEATLQLADSSRAAFERRLAGDEDGAIALYRQILEDYPNDPVARTVLAEMSSADQTTTSLA